MSVCSPAASDHVTRMQRRSGVVGRRDRRHRAGLRRQHERPDPPTATTTAPIVRRRAKRCLGGVSSGAVGFGRWWSGSGHRNLACVGSTLRTSFECGAEGDLDGTGWPSRALDRLGSSGPVAADAFASIGDDQASATPPALAQTSGDFRELVRGNRAQRGRLLRVPAVDEGEQAAQQREDPRNESEYGDRGDDPGFQRRASSPLPIPRGRRSAHLRRSRRSNTRRQLTESQRSSLPSSKLPTAAAKSAHTNRPRRR